MRKTLALIFHSSPLVLGIFLSYLFWRSSILLLFVYALLVVALILFGKDRKVECWIFIYGMVVGFVIEVLGTEVSGYQSFTAPDVLGIPYWLIISWGYGFLLMKRVALILSTGRAWTPRG